MMDGAFILAVSAAYLMLLFAIAYFRDRPGAPAQGRNGSGAVVYTLSIAVYCTSWTFFGSVGRAASGGIDFLPVYLGPSLMFFLGWPVLRKILWLSKQNRITSIADFLAARYGKSGTLAVLVTVIAVLGMVPYIALQLKAVSNGFVVLTEPAGALAAGHDDRTALFADKALWAAVLLGLFAILFGTRRIDASEHHQGMVAAMAFDSLVKLICLTVVGVFVGLVLFDGFGDLFARAAETPELLRLFRFEDGASGFDWGTLTLVSMAAAVCLPRQFQVVVVENTDESHLDRSLWMFPLYLFLINLFVLPIAVAGRLIFPPGTADPDTYVLILPLLADAHWLALLAFIGGLSAATGMVVVETVALSTMISNDLVMPALLRLNLANRPDLTGLLLGIRRIAIAMILLLGFLYTRLVGEDYALVSIGLISFAAVTQFFPAMMLGLFWRRANTIGALTGIAGGFLVWFYTLILPAFAESGWLPQSFLEHGPYGIEMLRPQALFGLDGMTTLTHGVFWSLLVNLAGVVGISAMTRQSVLERTQAAMFVDPQRAGGGTPLWRGHVNLPDLRDLVARFLGREQTTEAFAAHASGRGLSPSAMTADAEVVQFAERLLAGAIGTASARVMVASVAEEEPVGIEEVMMILDAASQVMEYNRQLEEKSRQLEAATADLRLANERLKELDRLKDEFVSTVSHELRTPLTSIRSFSEILYDNPDLEVEQRQNFLDIIIKETERLTRLINQMLDLAKIEARQVEWRMEDVSLVEIARNAAAATSRLFHDKGIRLDLALPASCPVVWGDHDRLMQVVVNLLSNAVKFTPEGKGWVVLELDYDDHDVTLSVTDNGQGIAPQHLEMIFDRFRQVGDTLTNKPAGTGLGLAISRVIVEQLGGRIWAESELGDGATFRVRLPRHFPEISVEAVSGATPSELA